MPLEVARDAPGTMGDPVRVLDSLPGVVPVANGLPFLFVRGSPPAGTLYVYDGIPLPMIFHLAFGPSVIHPRMLGPLQLYAGVAPARFGRHVGGVVLAEGPAPGATADRARGELELRALDANGYVEIPVGDGGLIQASARYGWPALIAQARASRRFASAQTRRRSSAPSRTSSSTTTRRPRS